jgi:asparagine synthetase B (glutamine-hydrolysing)
MAAALLLIWRRHDLRPADHERFELAAAAFPRVVRCMRSCDVRGERHLIRTWTHHAAFASGPATDRNAESWLAVTGNPSRPSLGDGDRAVDRLLAECSTDLDATLATLSPPFALAHWQRDRLRIAIDRCGLQHMYVREEADGTVWAASSSFALAALGATPDIDAAAEWLAAGHFVSERTFAREVRKLGPGEVLELDESVRSSRVRPRPERAGHQDSEARYRAALLSAISAAGRESGLAAELTGGLDSRAILAGRLAAGVEARSWTIGESDCADQRTVERLRHASPFDHLAIAVDGGAAHVADRAREMHELGDGEVNALEYAPLLFAFERLGGEVAVSLSGAGGEIGRAYYHAAIRPHAEGGSEVSVDKLLAKLSGATAPVVAALSRDRFPQPLAPLRGAVERALEASRGQAPDVRLDDFYVRARMQRFGGRNTSTTGLFWRQALPFFDDRVVEATLALPTHRKRDGAALRSAIADWAPVLARVPLDSGIAVAPRSWRAPATMLRWSAAMGRKAAVRYGGATGRRLVRAPGDSAPWDAVRRSSGFRELIGDTLLSSSDVRVHEILDPGRVRSLAADALAGAPLYPLGLVLTLELTLRRLAGNG